ncbi:hypothetical protein GCM10009413_05530 [Tatumella punctata]
MYCYYNYTVTELDMAINVVLFLSVKGPLAGKYIYKIEHSLMTVSTFCPLKVAESY